MDLSGLQMVKDALGRKWQLGNAFQVDYNLSEAIPIGNISVQTIKSTDQWMIHRAAFWLIGAICSSID